MHAECISFNKLLSWSIELTTFGHHASIGSMCSITNDTEQQLLAMVPPHVQTRTQQMLGQVDWSFSLKQSR